MVDVEVCLNGRVMPVGRHWALRGGFAPRANPGRPNAHLPLHDLYRQPHSDFFISFYHRSQESARTCDVVKKRMGYAYDQRRMSEINRLQKTNSSYRVRYLDRVPLSKNVTLTIEIPNAEHAGMIARMEAWSQEDSIPQIMHDTGVLIQFPDLVPDGKYGNDYVNRVKLTGPLPRVEEARIRVRNFAPIAISFPLRTLKSNLLVKDVKSVIDKAIADKSLNFPNLEILVQFPQLQKDAIPSCIVRGTQSHERDICDACTALHKLLFDAASDSEHSSARIYTTMMDIPAVQQLAVIGVPDGFLVRLISQETNASIYFPTVSDRHFGATAFYLSGSVPAIMQARKYIQGLLPVQLIFDVENDDLLNPVDASNRELFLRDHERNLTVMVKKSDLEGVKLFDSDTLRNVVIIESEEYNLTNVYAVRHQLFRDGVLDDEPIVVANDSDFFQQDFKTLVAKSNQMIAESVDTIERSSRSSLLFYPRLPQKRCSNLLHPVVQLSSSFLNENAELLPSSRNSQETLQPSEVENKSLTASVEEGQTDRDISVEGTVPFSTASASTAAKVEQHFFPTTTPILDTAGVQMEYINRNRADHKASFDGPCDMGGVDGSHHSSVNFSVLEARHETNYASKKLPVSTPSLQVTPQPQGHVASRTDVDTATSGQEIAEAMIKRTPSQCFLAADAARPLKSTDHFERLPRIIEKTVPEAAGKAAGSIRDPRHTPPERNRHPKKNLSLKPSHVKENYGYEYLRDMGMNTYSRNSQIPSRGRPCVDLIFPDFYLFGPFNDAIRCMPTKLQ